jgi:mono/diheme cytochrome c family protein
MAHKENSIRGVLMGRNGEIVVNGKTFNGVMVPLNYLTDEQIANVLTYVRNSWGNAGDAVTLDEVARIRQEAAPPTTKNDFE